MRTSYKKIIKPINAELEKLSLNLQQIISQNNCELNKDFENYLFSTSKQIRSVLIFLFAKALNQNISQNQINIATSIELIHNASLIHDDIIDNSTKRRNSKTLNAKYNNTLSVVAGDYLFSLALKPILELNNPQINDLYIKSLLEICKGEINQNFNRFKVPTIEQYIEKSRLKTAKLFEIGLLCILCLDKNIKYIKRITDFSNNFGIAFQIRDDIKNFEDKKSSKPVKDDVKQGVYSLPVIFAFKDNPNLKNKNIDDIIKSASNSKNIIKSKKEFEKYINKALKSIDFLENNQYKQAITGICKYLCEN